MTDRIRADDAAACLTGGGSMGAAMRGHDWNASPLGPPNAWPGNLQSVVSLLLAAGQPMFIAWGADRTLLYNDAYGALLGQRHPGALGQRFFAVLPEAEPEVAPLFARVFAGESIDRNDSTLLVDRNGTLEERYYSFSYVPIRDDAWGIAGIFCVCRETTDAVVARRSADDQNRRLSQMFHDAPICIAILEGRNHRVVLANDRCLQLVRGQRMVGKTLAEALPEAVERGYLRVLDQVFKDGAPYVERGVPYEVLASPSAAVAEGRVDIIFQPLTDAGGRVTGIFVVGTDVTDRVRAEQALQHRDLLLRQANALLEHRVSERTAQLVAREALIRTFYEHSSECHAVLREVDAGSFKYEEINPATLALYGKTREEVIGHTVDELFDAKTATELSALLADCLRSNAPHRYERTQGEAVVEAIATPVPVLSDAGRQIVVSARDVTEQRALERQLMQSQKMEAVGQLTGGLAHDFNNLLTIITGSLEIIQGRVAQGRIQEIDRYIASAQGAARRASAVTNRLLSFARRQTLDAKPVDVNRLVTDMLDLIRRTVGPGITVEIIGAIGLWTVSVDANQLENALLNLCLNARDAMPDGGRIMIETANRWIDERTAKERDLPRGQYISLCVSDTGCGMAAGVAARAFDPFFTTKPLGQGTGLGLSMIYGFARQSGGIARIYSEAGKGAMICLYLPRHLGDAPRLEPQADPTLPTLGTRGDTILVVDDEPMVRMLVVEVIEEMGSTALEAGDANAGLKILESTQALDLLITDVGLPNGMNGRQLADAARALRPNLKVLFITGYAENAVFSHGHLATGFEVLTKPFPMDVLAARIALLLAK